MRIHEVEIYSSKQIYAFIEYLKVLAEEKKAIEAMQSHYKDKNTLVNANCIGLGAATEAVPEYMAKLKAEAMALQEQVVNDRNYTKEWLRYFC